MIERATKPGFHFLGGVGMRSCIFVFLLACVLGHFSSANLAAQLDPTDATAQLSQELEEIEFFGVPLFDDDFYKLLVRLTANLVAVGLVVGVYHKYQHNRSYVFTFLLLNLVVFFICFTLKKMELGLGMALGLFAIFGIVRYRTDQIKFKEMTYLFIVIGLAVINSLTNKKMSYAELMFTNAFIFGATLVLESQFMNKIPPRLKSQELVDDKIGLLHPDRNADLIADLKMRTGLDVQRVDIKRVDLTSGTARINIRYPGEPS